MWENARNNLVMERRLFERIEAKCPVKLDSKDQPFDANIYLRDFSAGGVRIITKKKLNTNQDLDFWVAVPDGHDPLQLQGKVVWLKDVGKNLWDAGICFKRIHLMDCQRLLNCSPAA